MIRPFWCRAALTAISCLIWSQAAEAAVWCPGKVKSVLVGVDGTIQADWSYGSFEICNINQDITQPSTGQAIGYKTCEGIYSMLLTAEVTSKTFEALLVNQSDCSSFVGTGSYASQVINNYNILQ